MNSRLPRTTNLLEQASIKPRLVGPKFLRESTRETGSFPHYKETSGGEQA